MRSPQRPNFLNLSQDPIEGSRIGGISRKERPLEKGRDDLAVSLDDRTTLIGLSSGDVVIVGTLKGLVSEREMVIKAFEVSKPDVVGLHIGSEEIKGLRSVVKGDVDSTYLSSYEKVYARELSKFGEVQIPPPSLVQAYEMSKEQKVPVKALDFNETRYSNIYIELIDGMTMIRQSLRLKRINRRKFRSDTPEEFILEWDSVVNKLKGFKKLEREREKKMAGRIEKLSGEYGNVLAIVEYERKDGIIKHLLKDDH